VTGYPNETKHPIQMQTPDPSQAARPEEKHDLAWFTKRESLEWVSLTPEEQARLTADLRPGGTLPATFRLPGAPVQSADQEAIFWLPRRNPFEAKLGAVAAASNKRVPLICAMGSSSKQVATLAELAPVSEQPGAEFLRISMRHTLGNEHTLILNAQTLLPIGDLYWKEQPREVEVSLWGSNRPSPRLLHRVVVCLPQEESARLAMLGVSTRARIEGETRPHVVKWVSGADDLFGFLEQVYKVCGSIPPKLRLGCSAVLPARLVAAGDNLRWFRLEPSDNPFEGDWEMTVTAVESVATPEQLVSIATNKEVMGYNIGRIPAVGFSQDHARVWNRLLGLVDA
jgi:hypothetical protein